MVISVFNHKGGTGKTTTTINLGVALAEQDFRVLLVDFDLQANLSYSLGVGSDCTLESLLESNESISQNIVHAGILHVLPNIPLGFDKDSQLSSPFLLANALQTLREDYDFILIDCPPTISDHAKNALCASDSVLIPFQLDVLSVQGIIQVTDSIQQINEKYGHNLEILGVVPVMVDRRRMLTTEILEHLKTNYSLYIFDSIVRTNVKIAEAPSFGKSVIEYRSRSIGSQDYRALANEFIQTINNYNRKILT